MEIDASVALARTTPEGEAEYQTLMLGLRQLWLDLEPVGAQPTLSRSGFKDGLWTLGRREHHSQTRTYETFHVLEVFFVPIVFYGAYRVCESPAGNVVFLGRHPLPAWAHTWNVCGGAAVVPLVTFSSVSPWKALMGGVKVR